MNRIIPWMVVLGLVAVPASAFHHDSITTDKDWHTIPRDVETEWSRFGFHATSTSTNEEPEVLGLDYDVRSRSLNLSVSKTDEDGVVVLEDWMIVRVVAFVEFQDLDGDGAYGLGDPLVQRIPAAEGSDPRITGLRVGDDYRLTARHFIPGSNGGALDWTFSIVEDGENPAWFESTMELSRFEFDEEGSSFAVETRTVHGVPLAEGVVGHQGDDYTLFWSWSPTARDGDHEYPVEPTQVVYAAGDRDETLLVFSHGHNSTFTHNMTLGAIRSVPEGSIKAFLGDWKTYVVGLLISGGLVALTVRYVIQKEEGGA